MQASRCCPVCGSLGRVVEVSDNLIDHERWAKSHFSYSYIQCSSCQCIYSNQEFNQDEVSQMYPPEYMNRDKKSTLFLFFRLLDDLANAIRINNSINKYLRVGHETKQILDFGSGNSSLSRLLTKRFRNLVGTSFDPFIHGTNSQFAKQNDSTNFSFDRFDVISLIHVIEHLSEPLVVLKTLNLHLKSDGSLIIITPNIGDPTKRIFGKYWCFTHYPYHLTLFDETSLHFCLTSGGFEVLEKRIIFAGNTIAYSLDNLFKSIYWRKSAGHSFIYPYLALICAPIEWLLWRVGIIKSVQYVHARKKPIT